MTIHAISNTGPLISVFQSNSFTLLTQIFSKIYISNACLEEVIEHGWKNKVEAVRCNLNIVRLNSGEIEHSLDIARQIAQHPKSKKPIPEDHIGEAQAITLALRSEHRNVPLLLDELIAREIAQSVGVQISGFPGLLLLAVGRNLISPENLKERLEACQNKGTHYGHKLIQRVYEQAKEDRS